MYNWSTDESELKKDPEKYKLWQFEQMANFGLRGGKFEKQYLREHVDEISLDPWRRKFLHLILGSLR